jgi:hypothetical protein
VITSTEPIGVTDGWPYGVVVVEPPRAPEPDAPEPIHDPTPGPVITDRVPKLPLHELDAARAPSTPTAPTRPSLVAIAIGAALLVVILVVLIVAR